MSTVQLTNEEFNIIKNILQVYPYKFYVFGSRVKSTAHPFSDLDLCYKSAIPLEVVSEMKEAFEESDLPFEVDLVSWHRCTDDFKACIQSDLQPFP